MIAQTVSAFGRRDVAYNNASVQNVLAETADFRRDDYDRVMSINLRGVWSCMKFELQQMRKQGSGAIVNCSSLGGLVGGAERGTYHAANHGVLGLTKIAALEYAARSRGARIQECGSWNAISRQGCEPRRTDGAALDTRCGNHRPGNRVRLHEAWLCNRRSSVTGDLSGGDACSHGISRVMGRARIAAD